MRQKTVIVLLIIFACIAVGVVLVLRYKGISRKERSIGIHLFCDIPVQKIWEIDIKGADTQVSLIKKDSIWRVKEHFSYLADFSQISDLMEKLKSVNTGESFKADRETLKRLMLMDPNDSRAKEDEKGRALVLKDREGRILKYIIFGKGMRQDQGKGFPLGQYVRFSGSTNVYLIDQYFTSLMQGPREWMRLEIVNVRPLDIKEIRAYKGTNKPVYVLIREKGTNKFRVQKAPLGKKIDDKLLRRIKDGINYLSIEDVVDPKKDVSSFGIDSGSYVEYELSNGMMYRVYPSKKCDKEACYMRISVSYSGSDKSLLKKAKKLNRMLSPWTYKISKWRHESFFLP